MGCPGRLQSIRALRRRLQVLRSRSPAFVETYERVREQLRAFIPTMDVVLFPGAGTLANGEFGERLTKQATSAGLRSRQVTFPYGKPWEFKAAQAALDGRPRWIWGVHLETSTGVLNDVATLLRMAGRARCGWHWIA